MGGYSTRTLRWYTPRVTSPFVDHVLDLLAPLGAPSSRAMFGGYGVYLDGRIVAIVVDDELYLKSDDATLPTFVARGMEPFAYEAQGRLAVMQYYRVGAEVLEQPGALLELARLSQAASARAAAKKQRR